MRKVLAAMLAVMTVCLLVGCGTEVELDVPRFNRISRAEVEKMLGEPVEEREMDWRGPFSILKYEIGESQYTIFIDQETDRVVSMRIALKTPTAIEENRWNEALTRWNIRIDRGAGMEQIANSYHFKEGINGGIEHLILAWDENAEDGKRYMEWISIAFDNERVN